MQITIKNLNFRASLNKVKQSMIVFCSACAISIVSASNAQYAEQHDHYDSLPDLGSQASNFLSDADAAKLGKAFIRQSRYQQPYVSDPELVNYINRIGNELLSVSSDAGKPYHFYLIDNNVINAFAVPGGHIALHTAILTKSESESELASVIAHEISHVTQHHIARKLENSRYDNWLALGALLAAAAVGGGDAAQAAFGVANASIIDRQLSYSRAFEAEADSLGIRLLSRAKYDPRAMSVFFKRLLDESRINDSNAPAFLRSHPLTIDRISESSERIKSYPIATDIPDQSEFLLMQAKARASYASNKEQVRDLYQRKLQLGDQSLPTRYGYALALAENNEYDKARQALNKLSADYPDNVSVRLVQADNELNSNNIDKGLAMLKTLYQKERAAGNYIVDLYYANALVLTRHNKQAIPILRSSISNDPAEPFPHILLSRAYGETGQDMLSYYERGEFHYLRGNYEFALKQFQRAKKLAVKEYDQARFSARIDDVEKEIEELKNL